MAVKTETSVQLEKRKTREAKEMNWLLHEREKQNLSSFFFIYMMILLCIIYMVDEFTSNVLSGIQTQICNTFFPGVDISTAQGYLTYATFPGYLILIIAPFYKSLADKIGRRAFLAINVLGMGVSMLIIFLSTNIFFYVLGAALIQMFVPNDMQVMYIMECAPKKHRAKLAALAKGIGLTSVSIVALLRSWVFNTWGETEWQRMLIIPIGVALIVGVLAFITIDETPVFLERRINYLRMSDEERKAQVEQSKKSSVKTIDAFKMLFKNKQLKWVTICGVIFAVSTIVTSGYEPIMTAFGMTTAEVTIVISIFPFLNAFFTCLSGLFIDKMGRKRSAVLLGSFGGIMVTLFILGCNFGWNPYLIGIFYGSFLGGFWQVSDILFLYIPTESSPTEMRASVLGALSLIFSVGCGVAMIVRAVGGGIFHEASFGWFCYIITIPLLALSLFFLMTKVKETAGNNLNAIKEDGSNIQSNAE